METFKVLERLKLLDLLPAQGDITTLRIVRTLREELSFSEAEHAELEFKVDGQQIHWNAEKDKGKSVDIGAKAREVIVSALKRASQEQRLALDTVPLYERFVEE